MLLVLWLFCGMFAYIIVKPWEFEKSIFRNIFSAIGSLFLGPVAIILVAAINFFKVVKRLYRSNKTSKVN